MSYNKEIVITSLTELDTFAQEIAQKFFAPDSLKTQEILTNRAFILYLKGNLGSGKTTWTRSFLHALGFSGKVKSPTFTLVEPYTINGHNIYHFDLYRLKDPHELEYLGADDYFNEVSSICLIEWPEYSQGLLPDADLSLEFDYVKDNPNARKILLYSN